MVSTVTPTLIVLLLAAQRIVVKVESSVSDGPPSALTSELLVSALELRLGRRTVEMLVAPNDAPPPAGTWHVTVGRRDPRHLSVRIEDGADLLLDATLVASGRHPRDQAHTVALLVLETLAPLLPDIVTPAPPLPPEPPPPPSPPQPAVSAPRSALDWSAGVSPHGRVLLPKQQSTWGLGIDAQLDSRVWGAQVGARWSSPLRDALRDVRLRLTDVSAYALGSAHLDRGGVRLGAGLGPAIRVIVVGARGDGINFRERTYTDIGGIAEASAAHRLGHLDLGLRIGIERYAHHPIFTIDGARVVNTGHTVISAGCRVGWGR